MISRIGPHAPCAASIALQPSVNNEIGQGVASVATGVFRDRTGKTHGGKMVGNGGCDFLGMHDCGGGQAKFAAALADGAPLRSLKLLL